MWQSGLKKNKVGGEIPWSVTICETSQTYFLIGRRPLKDVLGNHVKDLFSIGSLVEYHPITAKDRSRIHQFGMKSYFNCSSDTLCKGDGLVADLEELETMDASEILSKRLNAKDVTFPEENENLFSNRRWTNQNPWRRSSLENILLETASTNSRRKSR